ncbi:hypothetical protein N7463_005951 [Penicillium fimorum]|uniref:Uncharacterized protein n=1 Tax=Penicillium fimorum TaxID=1882269 RepID=A0A9X0C5P3_9EURO|nr:hypothetical protein N7463_005951 [Penicillium fimorum]
MSRPQLRRSSNSQAGFTYWFAVQTSSISQFQLSHYVLRHLPKTMPSAFKMNAKYRACIHDKLHLTPSPNHIILTSIEERRDAYQLIVPFLLDLGLLFSSSRVKWPALYDGVWRYDRSKLGNILFAKELNPRPLDDQDPVSKPIYAISLLINSAGGILIFGGFLGWLIRTVGSWLGQSLEYGAATALYLAASHEVREQDHRGQCFIPIPTLCESSVISGDIKLARDLWDWIDNINK